MSTRQPADRQRIERFLHELGQRFRKAGRVYLVGGTTIVLEGFRDQSLDIDLAFEVAPADHGALMQAIRELKDHLGVNVEEVSPADFIPLPAGYQDRAVFLGRFGSLEVFHFDFYSTALSKIARGTEEDLRDVAALVRASRIEMNRLEDCYREIRPRLAVESLKQDPEEFDLKFEALRQLLTRD